jgi:hypothetical protein
MKRMDNIMLEVTPGNRLAIEDILQKVAGRAVLSTIRTYPEAEMALTCVQKDFDLRFPVPKSLNFSVRYVFAGAHRVTTELVFCRNDGRWFLDSVVRTGPFLGSGTWIKYRVDAWAYANFKLRARDGRSMRSVEWTGEEMTAHQRVALAKLEMTVRRRPTLSRNRGLGDFSSL